MRFVYLALALNIFMGLSAHAMPESKKLPPLKTVSYVDINQYLGKWYEIARFDHGFEKNCVAATATYSLRPNGTLNVINQCHANTVNGPIRTAKGIAKIADPTTNAKLNVTFFWPFYGKYWIIDLGANYEYAVIGHPNRNYLWILSRTPHLDQAVLEGILQRLVNQNYDLSKLIMPPQQVDPPSSGEAPAGAP